MVLARSFSAFSVSASLFIAVRVVGVLFTQEPTPSLQHLFLELASSGQIPLRVQRLGQVVHRPQG
jgi:hypothetical protein